ncbi:C13 family peptidase [Stenotrophomonas sp. YIM B06876]|uniref:C13 family peptidase n=1 Tax=Stenotrophomonas sp. YIM B06876 TaxID=3060211 RepID=UPI002739A7BF|nr:C13 family peptidase [Stenotrophomonas sp. YIM B06876]
MVAASALLRSPLLRGLMLGAVLLAGGWPSLAGTAEPPVWAPTPPVLEGAQLARLERELGGLLPQRAGVTDLYVLGVAGDASEDVFRNEVVYLRSLFEQRFGTTGRNVSLINHAGSRDEAAAAPLATYESLGYALDVLGQTLDPDEDVLLLYLTSHGLEDSSFYLQTGPDEEDYLAPEDLAQLLDEAGIGNAVIVVSACYAGGFVPALKAPNRMVVTAARHDRPSFGCGNSDSATWFGRAFLVEALNATSDFATAFEQARATVRRREREEKELPSHPQIAVGQRIGAALARWRAALQPGAAVPYPFIYAPPDAGDGEPASEPASASAEQ